MKFTLLAHPTFFGANKMLMEKLKRTDKTNLRENHIVLVPDRYTLNSENELLEQFGCSLNVHIYTFRRFAAELLPKTDYLSKENAVLVLTKLVTENAEKLSLLKGTKITYGLIVSLYEIIGQLKYSKISPGMLKQEIIPDELKDKIKDIRFIYEKYEEFIKGRFIDSADKMSALTNAVPYSRKVHETHFYLKNFDNLSAQELSIVRNLIIHSKSVTASATYYDEPSHCMLYLNDLFESLTSTARSLIKEEILPADCFDTIFDHSMDEETAFFQKHFTSAAINDVIPRPVPDNLTLFCASTPYEEVKALALYIAQKVGNGENYDDFTVIMSERSRFSSAVRSIFPEYGIPFYIDSNLPLIKTPLASFVLSYLKLWEETPFSPNKLMHLTKNHYFSCEEESLFLFERYVRKYNCASAVSKSFSYEKDGENYDKIEAIRLQAAFTIDCPLAENSTVSYYTSAIKRLLERCNAEELTAKLSDVQNEMNLKIPADYSKQAFEKLSALLSTVDTIMGNMSVSLKSFITILSKGMEAVNISALPASTRCVEFIEMAKSRRHNYRNIAVLGANDGVFPIIKGDFGLLSDVNLSQLAEVGIDIQPGIKTLNQRERFDIYQLFLEPRRSVFISFSASSQTGADAQAPSTCVKHLRKMFTDEKGSPLKPYTRFDFAYEFYPNRVCAEMALKEKINDTLVYNRDVEKASGLYYALDEPLHDTLILKPSDDRIKLPQSMTKETLSMSASRNECFYSCPHKHFLRYGVKLRPLEEDDEPDAAVIGTVMHAVLEAALKPYTKNNDFSETDEQLEKRTRAAFDNTISDNELLKAFCAIPRNAAAIKKLRNECVVTTQAIVEQTRHSDFKPLLLESRFGKDKDSKICIETDSGKLFLTGVIDRIDVDGNDAVIIDYKTGNTKFSLDSLYKGNKLQLTTYLLAIDEKYNVAGLYYLRLNDAYKEDTEAAYTCSGVTLKDAQTAVRIDNLLKETGKSKRIGQRLTKTGELYTNGSGLFDGKTISAMKEYTRLMYKKAAEMYSDGFIASSPIKNTCKYCEYEYVCHYNDTDSRPER